MQPECTVSWNDLQAASKVVGTGLEVLGPPIAAGDPTLAGDYTLLRLREGLVLHSSDTHELHDLTTRVMQRPGMTLFLFLKGRVNAAFDGKAQSLGALLDDEGAEQPAGLVVNRVRPVELTRRSTHGEHIRKVNVTISPDWLAGCMLDDLENAGWIRDFATRHLAEFRWTPSASAVALAEQILHPPAYTAVLKHLYLESRCLEIVSQVLRAMDADCGAHVTDVSPADARRLTMMHDYIEAKRGVAFTLSEMARSVGASINTLQKLFHDAHGTTVFEFVRRDNLQRARDALERDGISVTEAAFIAGYAGAANFSTAFKRCFGVPPKDVRRN